MPVQFTEEAARRIAAVTRRVEKWERQPRRDFAEAHKSEPGFWAMLMGADTSGQRYSFNKVVPDPDGRRPGAFLLEAGIGFGFDGEPQFQCAYESNGNRGVPSGAVVYLRFIGYDNDDPIYLFTYEKPGPHTHIGIHDHRDNYNGGFAFATYHPGTSIPQQPWAL
ncbi:MAG: hypothetical protein AAF656_00470 [Planctomycetota bacterium]